MAFSKESTANGEVNKEAEASDERASSCYHSSSSAMSSSYEDGLLGRAGSKLQHVGGGGGAATSAAENAPPPTQQMDRQSSAGADGGGGAGRIPAAVFERDPSKSNKDWSMMSTDSVFALQVAPSGDFTGFFLAHPELMDISTPPRTSTAAAADALLSPHLGSIPDLGEATMMMKGSYSFAFPNLIEDKRHSPKKAQEEEPPPSPSPSSAPATTTTTEAAEAVSETSSEPEAAPGKAPAKGGLLSCFPCCSS